MSSDCLYFHFFFINGTACVRCAVFTASVHAPFVLVTVFSFMIFAPTLEVGLVTPTVLSYVTVTVAFEAAFR